MLCFDGVKPMSSPDGSSANAHQEEKSRPQVRHDSWRYMAFTNIGEVKAELGLDHGGDGAVPHPQLPVEAARHLRTGREFLEDAEWALNQTSTLPKWWSGELHETAFVSVHHAAVEAVYLLPDARIHARLPMMLQFGEQQLGVNDDRVVAIRHLEGHRWRPLHVDRHLHPRYDLQDRAAIAEMVHDAYATSDENYAATRAYRNRIIRLTLIALALLVAVVLAAAVWDWPLKPVDVIAQNGAKVTWGDPLPATGAVVFLGVALMGAVGGFLSGVGAVAKTRGTRNPFSLPFYQMLLKLPVGGLSAVVGVLVLQVGFVPGVLPATTRPGLLVWAVVFGAAQLAITRLVDQRVRNLVGSGPPSDDEEEDQQATTRPTQPKQVKTTASSRRTQPAPATTQQDGHRSRRSAD